MQVLENAVKKLKMPSHVEEVSTRIEPRFETTAKPTVEPRTTPMPDPTPSSDPIPFLLIQVDQAAVEQGLRRKMGSVGLALG